MFATGFGARVDAVIVSKLIDVHANPRYNDRSTFVETSQMGDGFTIERGGIWNDLDGRVNTGLTKGDVNDVRVALGKLGMPFSFDQVDNLLQEALRMTARAQHELEQTERFHSFAREHFRAVRAAKTQRLRAGGKCIECGSPERPRKRKSAKANAASNIPLPGKSTCPACAISANDRTARRKKTAKKRSAAAKARGAKGNLAQGNNLAKPH